MNTALQLDHEPQPQPSRSVVQLNSTTAMDLLRMVVEQNAPLEKIERFLDLQERAQKMLARQNFNLAMSQFREKQVRVYRSNTVEQGPLKGTAYAKLSDFVIASASALSECGLSASWRITKDDKEWIEVACVVRHVDGHEETVAMGAPPDTGGAKNPVQARASTVSYLEKYTFKMALGLAEENDDDDGNGGHDNMRDPQGERPRSDSSARESKGTQAQGATDQKKAETKPAAPDEWFQRNLKNATPLLRSGTRTADEVIATLKTKASLSAEQEQAIRAIKPEETKS